MLFKLTPILKHRLWGDSMLPQIYNINTDDTIGEAWILSCINKDNNLVDSKKTLKDLFEANKNIVAKGFKSDFPILIKLIKANKDLSIQVHPEIKTEFWYVLNDKPSYLKVGFNKDTNRTGVETSVKDLSLPSLINNIEVKKGDGYLITPGTIHAICAGTFLIEIQQSADVTYRLYDYDRVDSNGQKRPLHINQSLDCLNYNKLDPVKKSDDCHLISNKHFNVYKYEINSSKEFIVDDKSFNSIVVIEGNGVIKQDNQTINLKQYDSIFVPASSGKYTIEGNLVVILTTL